MNTMRGAAETVEAFTECVTPALEALEDNLRQARRVVAAGRHTAEEVMVKAAREVKRHPMRAVAVTAGVGAAVGCAIGFALAYARTPPTSRLP